MVAKGGAKLINKTAVRDIRKELIKNSYLITPNIPEAEILTNKKIKNINEMIQSAKVLLNFGAKNVLIKGGHRKSKYVDDIFLNDKEIKIFKNKRYITKKHSWNRVHFIQCNCYIFVMWKTYKEIL